MFYPCSLTNECRSLKEGHETPVCPNSGTGKTISRSGSLASRSVLKGSIPPVDTSQIHADTSSKVDEMKQAGSSMYDSVREINELVDELSDVMEELPGVTVGDILSQMSAPDSDTHKIAGLNYTIDPANGDSLGKLQEMGRTTELLWAAQDSAATDLPVVHPEQIYYRGSFDSAARAKKAGWNFNEEEQYFYDTAKAFYDKHPDVMDFRTNSAGTGEPFVR